MENIFNSSTNNNLATQEIKHFVKYNIAGRDTNISIKVCNIFEEIDNAALIVPINTTFDTNVLGIREGLKSIQNQVVNKFYENDSKLFDKAIKEKLKCSTYKATFNPNKPKNKHQYPIGTVIELRPKNKHFYLVTTSHINQNERAEGTKKEQEKALIELWKYIKNNSTKTNLLIPLIGTGYARGNITREESVRLIIETFIKACSSKTFCDNLTIAIYPKDLEQHQINLKQLFSFLEENCKNPVFTKLGSKKSIQTTLPNNILTTENLSRRLTIIESDRGKGSGILINNQGLVISCYHNFYDKQNEQNIIKTLSIKTEGFWVEIPYRDNVDFCFEETKYDDLESDDIFLFRLKIDKNSNGIKDLPKLSVSRNVKQGDEVTVIAWDNTYDKNFVEHSGKVISVEPKTKDHPNRFHIKLDGYLGYSGGGVFKNGELVGIINYIQTQRDNNIIASFIPNYITKVIEEEINDNA